MQPDSQGEGHYILTPGRYRSLCLALESRDRPPRVRVWKRRYCKYLAVCILNIMNVDGRTDFTRIDVWLYRCRMPLQAIIDPIDRKPTAVHPGYIVDIAGRSAAALEFCVI